MNHLLPSSLLRFVDFTSTGPAGHQNILFLLPQETSTASSDYSSVIEIARYFAQHAYVYVARVGQGEMEDDEFGVRYMPLSDNCLSAFGALAKAFVFGNRSLAQAVVDEHPSAEVFLVHSSLAFEVLTDAPRAEGAGFAPASCPASMAP